MAVFKYLWREIEGIRPLKDQKERDSVVSDPRMNYSYIDWFSHSDFYNEAEKAGCYECEVFYINWKVGIPGEKGFMYPSEKGLKV